MKRYSQDFIDKVLFASDIVSLIQEDTELKGSGSRYMGLCPFPDHTEKTPSFSVSSEKQVYNCFGCQKSGNIFTYLKEQRGLSFREALEYLAGKAHIPLPKGWTEAGDFQTYKDLKALNQKAAQWYHKSLLSLPSSHKAKMWLERRGYSSEIIKTFSLGYAPKGNRLLASLQPKESRLALQLGLLGQSKNQSRLYDTYQDRLIFPIVSTKSEIVGFGARVLDKSLPKYINSRDSKIFNKGRTLYGLNQSGKFLKSRSGALIVEGYTDFLSLWQRGIKHIVATLGTALTEEHGAVLRRYVRSVTLLFDGDEAGVKAAERSLLKLLSQGLEVRGITLPLNQDPDEFIREKGVEALEALIDGSEDLFFQVLIKTQTEAKEKGRHSFYLIEKISPFLKVIPENDLRSLYKNRVLDIFGSDRSIMKKALDKQLLKKTTGTGWPKAESFTAGMGKFQRSLQPTTQASSNAQENTAQSKSSLQKLLSVSHPAERFLFFLCMESKPLFQVFLERQGMDLISGTGLKDLFAKLKTLCLKKERHFDRFFASLMNEFDDSSSALKTYYPFKETDREEKEAVFKDCLRTLERKNKKNKASEMVAALKMKREDNFQQLEKVFQLTKQRLRK